MPYDDAVVPVRAKPSPKPVAEPALPKTEVPSKPADDDVPLPEDPEFAAPPKVDVPKPAALNVEEKERVVESAPVKKTAPAEAVEIPSVSIAALVAKLKELPRSAALVQAVKNSPKTAFFDASTFVIVAKNSIEAGVLGKPESRAAISEYLESLCGRGVSVKIESANSFS